MIPDYDEFGDEEFIAANKQYFDKYIDRRVQGYSDQNSFMHVFGASYWQGHQQGFARIRAIEASEYFKREFNIKVAALKPHQIWSPNTAVHELLQLVRGDDVKHSVKLNAAKELNILMGIIVVDENGKTKAGRSLDDFYKQFDSDSAKSAA